MSLWFWGFTLMRSDPMLLTKRALHMVWNRFLKYWFDVNHLHILPMLLTFIRDRMKFIQYRIQNHRQESRVDNGGSCIIVDFGGSFYILRLLREIILLYLWIQRYQVLMIFVYKRIADIIRKMIEWNVNVPQIVSTNDENLIICIFNDRMIISSLI